MVKPSSATKFQLQLAKDITIFAWPIVAIFLHSVIGHFYGAPPPGLIVAALVGVPVGLLHRYIHRRLQGMPDGLATRQMQIHAIVVVAGYLVWISGIIYTAAVFADRAVWALASLLIPVLGVFCYWSVRVNLGRESTTWTK